MDAVANTKTSMESSLSEDEYKKIILHSIQRLIDDQNINIVVDKSNGRLVCNVEIDEPEWFISMDKVLRSNIIHNIQMIYSENIQNVLSDMNMKHVEVDDKSGNLSKKKSNKSLSKVQKDFVFESGNAKISRKNIRRKNMPTNPFEFADRYTPLGSCSLGCECSNC